jgi:DNA-binding response OmpR family regulator
MPSIAIVHNDADFLASIEAALSGAGDEIRAYTTVTSALIGIDEQPATDVLITSLQFPPGGSNGVALALMARRHNPNIKILFLTPPELQDETEGLGTVLVMPASIPEILDAVDELLRGT